MGKKILRTFIIITLFLITISLSACHGKSQISSFEIPSSFDESREYEISFWAKNDSNASQKKIYQEAIDSFQELYPNIHVTMKSYTNYEDIYRDVINNIETKTTPNVCITYPDHVKTYLQGSDLVIPLDGIMSDKKYGLGGSELKFDGPDSSEMIDQYLNECDFNGSHYAIPFIRSSEALYINKEWVEELGFTIPDIPTWDWIWEVSNALAKTKKQGQTLIPFIYKSSDNMMIQYLRQIDGGYSNIYGEILIYNDTTRKFLEKIAEETSLGAFSTFAISSYPGNHFNIKETIFAIDSTAGSTWMGVDSPLSEVDSSSVEKFETVVRPVPQADPSNPQMISQGPSLCVFNKEDDQEVLASWLFAQYLLTNDVQIPYAKTEGYVPVTKKAVNSEEYQDYLSRAGEDLREHYYVKIAASKLVIDNIENTFVTPVFNGSASLRQAAGALIDDTVRAVRRKQTINDAYFEKTFANNKNLYKLDQIEAQNKEGRGSEALSLGKLPSTAVGLIVILSTAWALIIAYFAYTKVSEYRKRKIFDKKE